MSNRLSTVAIIMGSTRTIAQQEELNEQLRESSCNGHSHAVLKSIEDGAEINSQNKVNGWTALHWATKRERDNIVIVLLKHGANPNIKNNEGKLAIDLTTREDIQRLLTSNTDHISEERHGRSADAEEKQQKTESARGGGSAGTVSFVPGYLANPMFPYAVAKPILTQAVTPSSSESGKNEPSVLVPGYLANPVLMTAAPKAEGSDDGAPGEEKSEQPVLVPGYLANPVIPYAMATGTAVSGSNDVTMKEHPGNESPVNFVPGYIMGANKNDVHDDFKQIFVPHVQQLGSLVNTYVNSMKSLETPVEYRMYNSCKTTPVATVFVSTPVSELVLKVRVAGTEDFFEVEMNSKLLTYDELLNVCCKELNINKHQINKLRKLPNTIIRRDKDIKRLQPYQELEILLN